MEDGRRISANRAASCLLSPEQGDIVLVRVTSVGISYVLAVLEKHAHDAQLDFEGALRISARSLDVQARENASLAASEVDLSGIKGRLGFVSFDISCGKLDARVHSCAAMLGQMCATISSCVQNLGNSLRRVSGMETLEAKRLRHKVRQSYLVKAKNLSLRAEQDAKLDGERVHLG